MKSTKLHIEYSATYLNMNSDDFFNKITTPTVFMYGTYSKIAYITLTSNEKTSPEYIEQNAIHILRNENSYITSIFDDINKIPKEHIHVMPILATPNEKIRAAYESASYGEKPIGQIAPKSTEITLNDFELAWRRTWEKGCINDNCVNTAIATMHNLLFDTQLTAYLLDKTDINSHHRIDSAMNRYLSKVQTTPNVASVWQNNPNIPEIKQLLQQNNMLIVSLQPNSILEYKIISPISLIVGHVICLALINKQVYAADNNQLWKVNNLNQLFNGTKEKPTKWPSGINIYVINKETDI